MPEKKIEFEIPPGYYTREELNNYILKMLNTPVHVCCTTKGNLFPLLFISINDSIIDLYRLSVIFCLISSITSKILFI